MSEKQEMIMVRCPVCGYQTPAPADKSECKCQKCDAPLRWRGKR